MESLGFGLCIYASGSRYRGLFGLFPRMGSFGPYRIPPKSGTIFAATLQRRPPPLRKSNIGMQGMVVLNPKTLNLGSYPVTVTVTTMGYRSYKNPLNKAPLRKVAGRGNDPT